MTKNNQFKTGAKRINLYGRVPYSVNTHVCGTSRQLYFLIVSETLV